jgi:transposase-like protein
MAEEKTRIVAESFEEGANISEVARRNGVARGLLTVWRHKLAAGVTGPGFVPVRSGYALPTLQAQRPRAANRARGWSKQQSGKPRGHPLGYRSQ